MSKNEKKAWKDLDDTEFMFSTFEIDEYPASERLYNNGRQQVRVGIALLITSYLFPDASGNPGPVPLSKEEVDSVSLALFRGGAPLPGEWSVQDQANPFDPYPEPGRTQVPRTPRGENAQAGTLYPDRYVTTTAGPTAVKMALSIKRDDGRVFVTNGSSDHPSGERSITLTPVNVPSYGIDNYLFVKTEQENNLDLFVHPYFVSYRNNQNEEQFFHNIVRTDPGGIIQWNDKIPSETHASYVGCAMPGASTVVYNLLIEYGAHTPSAQIRSPQDGKLAFVLIGRNDIRYHSDSALKYNGPIVVRAYDMYGNEHVLQVKFKDGTPGGRLELVLEKG